MEDDDWGLGTSDLDDWDLDNDSLDLNDSLSSSEELPNLDWDLIEQESSKEKINKEKISKLSGGRVVGAVLTGMIYSLILSFIICSIYINRISYPPKAKSNEKITRLYSLESYQQSLHSGSYSNYLNQEISYANGNLNKETFIKKVLETVAYTPGTTTSKNIYGNDLIDKKTKEVVTESSPLEEGEEVVLSYVDYSNIIIDDTLLQSLVSANGLTIKDVDYSNKLEDLFCQYISSLGDLPIVSIPHVPTFTPEGKGYVVSDEEDVFLDKLLFSSSNLYNLFNRFSEQVRICAGAKPKKIKPTKEWKSWNKLDDNTKSITEEPIKFIPKYSLTRQWCGSYHLQNELESPVSPELGDGTLSSPSSLNTPVISSIFTKQKKKAIKKYPIRVEMIEYGVSEDAIKWFESKDTRNRGIDLSSEVQYCYYKFRVTNLSSKVLTIKDNSALCDASANVLDRSGIVYGLTDSVTLKPDESGIIESWNKSTELNKKYVIWGKDFSRRTDSVWFRVLAGDLEDTSEEKGVTINKSRDSSNSQGESSETQVE